MGMQLRMLFATAAFIVCTNALPYTDLPYDLPSYYSKSEVYTQSEVQNKENSQYVFLPQQSQEFSQLENGFTVTCSGLDKACVPKELCVDGYFHSLKQQLVPSKDETQRCNINYEICCTIRSTFGHSSFAQESIGSLFEGQEYVDFSGSSLNDQKVNYEQTKEELFDALNVPQEAELEQQTIAKGTFVSQGGFGSQNVEVSREQEQLAPVSQIPEEQTNQFVEGEESDSAPVSVAPQQSTGSPGISVPLQLGCAAALLCVEERFCTLDGTISPEPVTLTNKQILRRVPLSSCKNPETNVIGKCCRDPNYVDPWPATNLPANYSGGFDEQGFPTFLNIAKVRPTTKRPPIKPPQPTKSVSPVKSVPPTKKPDISNFLPTDLLNNLSTNVPMPFTKKNYESASSNQSPVSIAPQLPAGRCGVRNNVPRPEGLTESDTAFGEIPWQAMVLWKPARKILCSGVLISPDMVLTAANCVDGLPSSEISVKLGEWKLGYELESEEPLPFEIIDVASIVIHPYYYQGSSSNDTAILTLKEPASYSMHINTLCVPDGFQYKENRRCMVTGWGKAVLQANYAGIIMHAVDVDVLSHDTCNHRVSLSESPVNVPNNLVCVKAQKQNNNMCQVDVGGPLACDNGNGYYELAGVYSQDTGCLPTNQIAVIAPLDTIWLKTTMENVDIPSPPLPDESVPKLYQEPNEYQKSNLSPVQNQYLPPV